jgi:phage terminase large subunit
LTQNAHVEFLLRYGPSAGEEGPVLFVREVLGVEPDDWQLDALRAYGRGERKISIRSCHGVGKTALLAWLVIYQACTRYPQKTVATAPSKAQLEDALVSEVMTWFAKLPDPVRDWFEDKKNRLELKRSPDASFFSARTAREENPEALQGIHSEHVLLIADEASGVPEKIFEAAVGSMSGHTATTILAGNPVRTSGLFFDSHNRLKASWYTIHVTAVKQPNHDPKIHGYHSTRAVQSFVDEVRDTYGENSNAFRIRALGEFPLGDLDTVIPMSLIMSAQQRDIFVPKNAREVWGLDVARFGDDDNVLTRRTSRSMKPLIEVWQGRDLMQTAGRVKARWDETTPDLRPEEILIDEIGMGGGVVDRLAELGLPVRGINVSESEGVDPLYRNLRTELWYKGREWLASLGVSLPLECTCKTCKPDPTKPAKRDNHARRLEMELAAQRVDYTSTGRLLCYPKSQMKKHLKGQSPNIADSFLLTFAGDFITLSRGSDTSFGGGQKWNEPIRLKRAVV